MSWTKGNALKKRSQKMVVGYLKKSKNLKNVKCPISISYTFYCNNRKRDLDNISGFFHKIFQDAMVEAHVIPDDSWRYITGFQDSFSIDREHPRIEVTIMENGE